MRYLQRGLAVILIGIGVEMLAGAWIAVPVAGTLGFVLAVLALSVAWSLLADRRQLGVRVPGPEPGYGRPARQGGARGADQHRPRTMTL